MKKTLIGIGIALVVLSFILTLIGIFAATLVMEILTLVFLVGAVVCIALALGTRKR